MLKSLKNRAFFFFNYGHYQLDQTETVNVGVPTLRMRSGDFSELLTDPYVLQFFGGPVQIFDNTVPCCNRPAIPGNRLDLYTKRSGPIDNRSRRLQHHQHAVSAADAVGRLSQLHCQ